MPPKKVMKLLTNQGKLNTFFNVNKDVNNNSEKNTNNDQSLSQSEAGAEGPQSELHFQNQRQRKIQRHFQSRWLSIYLWLRLEKVDNDEYMYCTVCTDNDKMNSMNKASRNRNFQHSTLQRHVNLQDHQLALAIPALKEDMVACQNKQSVKIDEAVKALLTSTHWMVTENLPLSKFRSFVGLLNELHLESISVLKSFHGISFDSDFSARNFLESLSSVAEEDLNQRLQASPIITVMSDESTDITNTKRLVVYAQIISEDMVPSTLYVTNMECKDATGRGIATALFEELKRRGVPASKVMSTGSDGASAMTGKQNGAAALMQRENPHMVNVHCVAHRLALCTSQAAANIPQLQSHHQVLTDLFYYFKGSAKRQEKLKEVQKILDDPQLIIKEIHSVRWLSYYSALSTVQRILDSLLTYLAEVDGNKDPKAAGLRKKIASETFISITYMMMDAIAPVTILSQLFQTENVDLALVKVKLELCIGDLEKVKTMDSPYLLSLKEDLKPGLFKGHVISNTNLNLHALTERFIDAMKDNIASRFPSNDLLSSFSVLALRPVSFLDLKGLENFGTGEMDTLCQFFGEKQTVHWKEDKVTKSNTSEPLIDVVETKKEWELLKRVVVAEKFPRDSMQQLWGLIWTYHKDKFTNLLTLARLALTSAVHTAGCERGFSVQNQILTKLRNRLTVETQSKLMRVKLCSLERIVIVEKALSVWRKSKNRRAYALSTDSKSD